MERYEEDGLKGLYDKRIILKGFTIGDNSIIAAHSIVVTNVPKNVLVAGNPAKVVKVLSE